MTTLKDQLLIIALVTALGGGLVFCGLLIPADQTAVESVDPSSEESADPSSGNPIVQVQSDPNTTNTTNTANGTELKYAKDIQKLGRRIAGVLDSIETLQDARQAVETLKPMGESYRKLHSEFNRYYMQDGGPMMNKLNNHPEDVQRAVLKFMRDNMSFEFKAMSRFAKKNLPPELKSSVIDTCGFSLSFFLMPNQQTREFFRNLKAPYIAPAADPNTPDPNTPTDPNMP
jgi:hypothetical protein